MVQVLRWIPLVWVLSLPASSEAPVPGSGFDRSLEDLERQRVITPQERRLLEDGSGAVPIPASAGLETFEAGVPYGDDPASRCPKAFTHRDPGPIKASDPASSSAGCGPSGRRRRWFSVGIGFCSYAKTSVTAGEWRSSTAVSCDRSGLHQQQLRLAAASCAR